MTKLFGDILSYSNPYEEYLMPQEDIFKISQTEKEKKMKGILKIPVGAKFQRRKTDYLAEEENIVKVKK